MKRFNPNNPKQARLFFCMFKAMELEENGHPVDIMMGLAIKHKFKIIDRIPQSLFDGWDFWVEFEDPKEIDLLPKLFRNIEWKPINQA